MLNLCQTIIYAMILAMFVGTSTPALQKKGGKKEDCKPLKAFAGMQKDPRLTFGLPSEPKLSSLDFVTARAPAKLAPYVLLPRTVCEVKHTFSWFADSDGSGVTPDDVEDLKSAAAFITDRSLALPEDARTAEGFRSYAERSDANFIVIIGYNLTGVFHFPDGSRLTLTDMAEQCSKTGKRCIFLPGALKDLGSVPESDFSYRNAIEILACLSSYFEKSSPGQVSYDDLARTDWDKFKNEATPKFAIRYLLSKTASSDSVIGCYISPIPTVDKRPMPLNNPRPEYTERARDHGVQGSVRVRVLVGSDGNVKQVKVLSGLPDGLNEAAITAAYKIKFKPAMKDGVPAAFWLRVDIEFHLARR